MVGTRESGSVHRRRPASYAFPTRVFYVVLTDTGQANATIAADGLTVRCP